MFCNLLASAIATTQPGTHAAGVDVARTVLILAVVCAIGLAIGHLKFKGLSIGVTGVLFVALAAAANGFSINHDVLEFLRDAGLILFVYTIGMQVGPGFFGSLRKAGLPLNLAAVGVIALGIALALLNYFWFFGHDKSNLPQAVGLLSGATTNTPSMAAAKEAFRTLGYDNASSDRVTQAYAIAYPLGVFGVLGAFVLLRAIFRIDLSEEQRKLAQQDGGHPALSVLNLEITNPALPGKRLGQIPTLGSSGVVVTRLLRAGKVQAAIADVELQLGDVLTSVGPAKQLEDFETIVGRRTSIDAREVDSDIDVTRILVSRKSAVGQSIAELGLHDRFRVQLTRIQRAGFELPVTPDRTLQFGDRVVVVGPKDSLPAVAKELGNSPKALDQPLVVPMMIGIALGVLLGTMPITIPGLPAPLKLGLAGGPLIVAILLSRLYKLGPLVWFMPSGANYYIREIGIMLFLACVGLKSGAGFMDTLKANGVGWILMGFAITFVPVMIVGAIARGVFKVNFNTLMGLLAGSMTDPPALAFSQQVAGSDAPTVAYASVYPLVMLLRILSLQTIVLMLGA
jgi:putative transport protein